MTTEITLGSEVELPDGTQTMKVNVWKSGCDISMSTSDENFQIVSATWEELNREEWLYETFKFERLVTMKALCTLLDKIHRNKATYMEMLNDTV